jgi:hypothetical protein
MLLSLTAASLMFGQIAVANAATFGQFQDGTAGTSLVNSFTAGTWTSATLGTTATYHVQWQYVPSGGGSQFIPYNADAPVGINIPAILSYTATTTNPSAPSISGFQQNYDSVTLTVTGTGTGAKYGVLLQMTAVDTLPFNNAGFLSGGAGASSATFQGSDQPSAPDTVTFSTPGTGLPGFENYIDWTGVSNRAYALSYSGVTPLFGQGGSFPNFFINNFVAETTGTFSALFPNTVPEPGSLSMLLGLGLTGGLFLRRRRS